MLELDNTIPQKHPHAVRFITRPAKSMKLFGLSVCALSQQGVRTDDNCAMKPTNFKLSHFAQYEFNQLYRVLIIGR